MKTLFLTLIVSTSAMATDFVSKVDNIIQMDKLTSGKVYYVSGCSTEFLIESDKSGHYKKMEDRIEKIHDVVVGLSQEIGVDACLIMSMIAQESSFKMDATSYIGAKGLMQVMSNTRKMVIKKLGKNMGVLITKNLNSELTYKELDNLIVGISYFKDLMTKFNNNQDIAVIAYNEGPSKIQRMINHKVSFGTKHNHLIQVKKNFVLLASN